MLFNREYFLGRAISIGLLLFSSDVLAAPASKNSSQCPKVLADKQTGVFSSTENFECFRSRRLARKAGYESLRELATQDFSGWWRFGVKLKADSCKDAEVPLGEPATLFLQINQSSQGIFAALCPGTEKYSGVLNTGRDGLILSSTRTLQGDKNCGGGPSETQVLVDLRGLGIGSSALPTIKVSQVKSCASAEFGKFKCSVVFEGQGSREKPDHRFWPPVSENVNTFGEACQMALTKCSGCHG